MITRRKGRAINKTETIEVEVVDALDTVEDLPCSSEGFLAEEFDTDGAELDVLFGIEDLKWTLEKEAVSPLLDIELADLGMCCVKDQDSGYGASTVLSPERVGSQLKSKKRQTNNVINKNAVAARLNRLKKKEYVNSLEKKVSVLSTENKALKQENTQLTKRVDELEDETRGQTQMTTTTPYPGNV